MAARSPPPLLSPHSIPPPPTTTISTIVVKAGDEAFLTVGVLESANFTRLRIDDMRPPLLSIGTNGQDTNKLIDIHKNLLTKLAEKEEECEALLQRAAALPQEKDEKEAPVYSAMAASLESAWRSLLKRLHLRSNLLKDVANFYRLVGHHEELTRVCIGAISALSTSTSPDGLARQIGVAVNEIVDTTASAMELGTTVMGQMRILGELSDGEKREEEIYEGMLHVENAMIKMASEWSKIEESWTIEKQKRFGDGTKEGKGEEKEEKMDEFERIGLWLGHAGRRLKASNEEGLRSLVAEAEENRKILVDIISSTFDESKLKKAGELAQGCEELIALANAALDKGSRLRNFFVSSSNTLQQLIGMEKDMERANEAMAGELAPLARQKAIGVKENADSLIESERLSYEEKRMITMKRNEVMERAERIHRLAEEKSDTGRELARESLRRGREWLVREAEPWMEHNGDVGGTIETARQFVEKHVRFAEDIVTKDEAINYALTEASRLNEEEKKAAKEFSDRYSTLKKNLETRIALGKTFEQVQEFARELESSFDALEGLIDQKAEHSERGIQQMTKVFEMIEETLGQERQQGECFISSASTQKQTDTSLHTSKASESVRNILVTHERRFTQMADKWRNWKDNKSTSVQLSHEIEEVQHWQEETVEIIRLWEEGSGTRSEHEQQEVLKKAEDIRRQLNVNNGRLETTARNIQDEETMRKVQVAANRQKDIEQRLAKVCDSIVEEQSVVSLQAQQNAARNETLSVMNEVQHWQEEKMELIRLWEEPKEERSRTQREEAWKKVEDVKREKRDRDEVMTRIKESKDEVVTRDVHRIEQRQREIGDRLEKVQQTIVAEENREQAIEEEKKRQVETLVHTLDEVQKWQEDVISIIRLWEDVKEPRTEEKRAEIQRKVEEVKREKVMKDEVVHRSTLTNAEHVVKMAQLVEQRQREIADRLHKIQQSIAVEHQQEKAIDEEKKRHVETIVRTLEEVQKWQEDVISIIRVWEEAKEEKLKQKEEIERSIAAIRVDSELQKDKLEGAKRKSQDTTTVHKVEEVWKKQEEVEERLRRVERSIQEESEKNEAKLRQMKEIENAKKKVEEVAMWQEEVTTIIKVWEQTKGRKTREERQDIRKSIEAIQRDSGIQKERLQTVKKSVTDEVTTGMVQRVETNQKEIEARLEKIRQRLDEEEKEEIEEQGKIEQMKRILEEIMVWQETVEEKIRLWKARKMGNDEKKEVLKDVTDTKRQWSEKNNVIDKIVRTVSEEESGRIAQTIFARQKEIARQLKEVEESLLVQEAVEVRTKPQIVSSIHDVTIEEGGRVEFVAKIHAQPDATITWLKDGVDVENSMDYRKTYVNGVATLTIDETFIEDSALYTLRAQNDQGAVETAARLVVKSASSKESAPRMVRGLKTTSIDEGDTLFLDCVVVAQPEPEVVWFKEEKTVKEDERTKLDFKGDHCSLTIQPSKTVDSGMYTAKAKNSHGEATSLCQVKVSPKKVPPPTPPKPERHEMRVGVPRPPAMQCTLTNDTYQQGMKAVLQVMVTGNPRPAVQWFLNDRPLKTTNRVKVTDEEASGWTRVIIDAIEPSDQGLYVVVAENELGEARTGATIHVQPKQTIQTRYSQEEASGSENVTTVVEGPPTATKKEVAKDDLDTMRSSYNEAVAQGSARREEVVEGGMERRDFVQTHTSQIPVLSRSQREGSRGSEIGLSNTSKAPEIIRGLHREYTFNETEELFLECLLVGNPRPKYQWFFNNEPIHPLSKFAEMNQSGDSYTLRIKQSALPHAGYYKIRVENVRGETESQCIVHIRPAALGVPPKAPRKQQHISVSEEFAMFEYEQRRPEDAFDSRIPTLRANGGAEKIRSSEYLEGYDLEERERKGHPPHFSQTLLSTVVADGHSAKFEGIVTGWPAPEMKWSKDEVDISRSSHPHIVFSNIGGRLSLVFNHATAADAGKYKCMASNEWGVASSSAQLVVRPKTVAPDFISRLISEEVAEGDTLRWTVTVSGDPMPKVTWLRDGIVVPNCEEVRLVDEGNGVHSMTIQRVEMVDSGQFTCLAENVAGEARSTADLVVRPAGTEPGHYFHVTKVTQEKQVKGQSIGGRNESVAIESPIV